jgi:hypothetical protein
MWKLVGWTCTAVFVASGLWDLGRSNPVVPPFAMGALLLGLGLLIGLRLGSDSTAAFVKDLLRLNKFMAEQNNQLTELNHWHVRRQVSHMSEVSRKSGNDA